MGVLLSTAVKGRAVENAVKSRPVALYVCVLHGMAHDADLVAATLKFRGDSESWRNVAAAVPRDDENVGHDGCPFCGAASRSEVTMWRMSCVVRGRE